VYAALSVIRGSAFAKRRTPLIVARPFGISAGKISKIKDKYAQMRFDLTVFTSQGELRIEGWQYWEKNNMVVPPSLPRGGTKFLPLVRMTANQRSIITKLARRELARLRALPKRVAVEPLPEEPSPSDLAILT
jgi:hypothetical protein